LFLSGGASFKEVRLLGAKIGGGVSAIGSTFDGSFSADRMETGGSLFLSGGASFKEVRLLGAKIGGEVSATGSTFDGSFIADGMETGGGLFLRGGASFKEVRLLGAKIGGDVSATGSTFDGPFRADRMETGGNLFLRDGASFKDVDLFNARIGGGVQMQGSLFDGEVDLSGASIRTDFMLSLGDEDVTDWPDGAVLKLRNVRAGALQASEAAWKAAGGRLVATDLTGFAYDRLGGGTADRRKTLADADIAFLKRWFASQPDHADVYDPQPYEQLARALEAAGAERVAEQVRFEKWEHKRAVGGLPFAERTGLFLRRWLVAHGTLPFLPLAYFGVLVLAGIGAAFGSRDPRLAGLGPKVWYSLENALPLVELKEAHKQVEHGRDGVEGFFHFQKVAGFALATILVGALTLLGG
ncbi:MAG: hypothetical protein AAF192_22275, partial [Pseudomonadota bacterium]